MKSLVAALVLLLAGCAGVPQQPGFYSDNTAISALEDLPSVVAMSPGYTREAFGPAWKDIDRNGCDNRSDVMRRDMKIVQTKEGTHGCIVLIGQLYNVYTNKFFDYERVSNSGIEVDHIVSLNDGWETGMDAQPALRVQFANDPINLITTDRASNRNKSAKNAAEWLVPDSPEYRCPFVARQISIKKKYSLGVTDQERSAMLDALNNCDEQLLVTDEEAATPRAFPIGEPRR